ncbi:MAG TPA: hypothetical protein VF245_07910 [Solirubrobacterales bacterium]
MSETSDVVRRATAYPYERPTRPFAQRGRETMDPEEAGIDPAERVALLAYGSNAAPPVLARKLAFSPDPVLVVPAALRGFDVVYSAHISPYGAIPATLQRSPGTAVEVHVIYMTEGQVELITVTESNYEPISLKDVECRLEGDETLTELTAYVSRHGCLLLDAAEVALAAVPATSRTLPEMTEPEALERIRALTAPDEDLESFVLSNVVDPELARSRSTQFEKHQLLF